MATSNLLRAVLQAQAHSQLARKRCFALGLGSRQISPARTHGRLRGCLAERAAPSVRWASTSPSGKDDSSDSNSSLGPTGSSSVLSQVREVAPGVAVASSVMALGFAGADVLGNALLSVQGLETAAAKSPVSGVPVSIVLGLLIRNALMPTLLSSCTVDKVTKLIVSPSCSSTVHRLPSRLVSSRLTHRVTDTRAEVLHHYCSTCRHRVRRRQAFRR